MGDLVEAELQQHWGGSLGLLFVLLVLGGLLDSGLLVLRLLSRVLLQQSEQVLGWGSNYPTLVGVNSLGELVERWRDLQSSHQDSLLSLDQDVSWPSDESGEVSLRLDGTANAESSWSVLEEAASDDVLLLAGSTGSGLFVWSDFLSHLSSFLFIKILEQTI